ncbi:hypothetical protein BGX34_003511 [Mortierella sp. NVP85]|nr:hypothetical protein BGX34_003511 [Mortierella sp. NVP85]
MNLSFDTKRSTPFFSDASSPNRPMKAAKVSSERRPFSSFKSKTLGHRHSALPPLDEDALVEIISPPKLRLDLPARFKSHNVHFLPFDQEKMNKASTLPRTPYPMNREDEERILGQFSKA